MAGLLESEEPGGPTSGRTILAGEGLQHHDGHSHVLASVIPSCRAYDPCFADELTMILEHGTQSMLVDYECAFYYLTLANESNSHPPLPAVGDVREGIIRGIYPLREWAADSRHRVQRLGSRPILREVLAAADLLEENWGVGAAVWSVTTFTDLHRDALEVERWNRLHPQATRRTPFITRCLAGRAEPAMAASDHLKIHADQVRTFVPGRYKALGTDVFGRSDDRAQLRRFFEIDARFITFVRLAALADEGLLTPAQVTSAAEQYEIDPERPIPILL